MDWKDPARYSDVSNPTPAICLHQGQNEIALLFVVENDVAYVASGIRQNPGEERSYKPFLCSSGLS
jgi:hypothetical protein